MENEACNIELVQILHEMSKGKKAVMQRLYALTSGELYSHCFRFIQNREASEDVLHEVYMKVWNQAGSYVEAKGVPMAWLTRIAHNSAVDWVRANTCRPSGGERALVLIAEENEPVVELLIREEQADYVREKVESLAPADASLIRIIYLRGLTYSEVARETALPLGAVKTRIRSGLRTMRDKMTLD